MGASSPVESPPRVSDFHTPKKTEEMDSPPPEAEPQRSGEIEASRPLDRESPAYQKEELVETEASSFPASGHPAPEGKQAGKNVQMSFDLNRGDYAQFIRDFRAVLVKHETPEMVAGHLVLAEQKNGKEPKRWMHITLVGEKGASTTLAIRDDNLYLIGFQGKSKRWYEFGISKETNASILENNSSTTFLGCDVTYKELLEKQPAVQVRAEMGTVKLGQRSAIEALGILSSYTQAESEVIGTDGRRALVRLILMFCEATRMIPFFNTVVKSWTDTTKTYHIQEDVVMYIWQWGAMSAALRDWKEKEYECWGPNKLTGELKKQHINIKSAGEALDVVEVLLRKNIRIKKSRDTQGNERKNGNVRNEHAGDRTDNGNEQAGSGGNGGKEQAADSAVTGGNEQAGDSNIDKLKSAADDKDNINQPPLEEVGFGRALVEVFGVRADSRVIATISIFDGKRGQILYKYQAPIADIPSTSQNMIELPLTGPYRAISADGSFAIQVNGPDKSGKNVEGEMFWNCYSDDAEYDKILTQNIGSNTEVKYALLSNAIETTVHVQLKLHGEITAADTISVHGEIMTHYEHYNNHSIMLFSCTKAKQMELKIPKNGFISIPIPLRRSVIALPVGLSLQINVKIHVSCAPNHEKTVHIDDNVVLNPRGQKNGKLMMKDEDNVEVQVFDKDVEVQVKVEGDEEVQVKIPRPAEVTYAVSGQSDIELSPVLDTTAVPGTGGRRKSLMGFVSKMKLSRWATKGKSLTRVISKAFGSRHSVPVVSQGIGVSDGQVAVISHQREAHM